MSASKESIYRPELEQKITDTGKAAFFSEKNLPTEPGKFKELISAMELSSDHQVYLDELSTLRSELSQSGKLEDARKEQLLKFKEWKKDHPSMVENRGYIPKDEAMERNRLFINRSRLSESDKERLKELDNKYQEKEWLAFLDDQEIDAIYRKRSAQEKQKRWNMED